MDPRTKVISLANEAWVARCLHAAAIFYIADAIGSEGKAIEELASEAELHPHMLRVILRVLSSREIFSIEGDRAYHTDCSELLRTEHPATIGDIVRWNGSEESWNAFGQLPQALRSGQSGFEAAFGTRMFDHLSAHAQIRETFRRSMEAFTRKQVSSVVDAADLSAYRKIIDIGGGNGLMARTIAEKYPANDVILFDLPGVLPELDGSDAISVVAGNFFVDPIPHADLLILMNVLHDWSDKESLEILASARRSINPGGCLFVIEGLVAPGKGSIALLELGMAVMTGGQQRTREEYETLLSSAGFRVGSEIACSEHLSILVAEPAETMAADSAGLARERL